MNYQEWRRVLQAWWSGEASPGLAPSMRDQLVLAAALLVSAGLMCLLWEAPGWSKLILLLVTVSVLASRSIVPVLAILAWVWLGPLVLEGTTWIAFDRLWFADVLLTMALLAFVIFTLRFLTLQSAPKRKTSLGERDSPGVEQRHDSTRRPLDGVVWRFTLAPMLAIALLWLAPREAMHFNALRLAPPVYRALLFFWGLGLAAVLLASAVSLLTWRKLTPRQAAIHVRQTVLDELGSESASLERARAKIHGQRGRGA